jgi:hypothetical protein
VVLLLVAMLWMQWARRTTGLQALQEPQGRQTTVVVLLLAAVLAVLWL